MIITGKVMVFGDNVNTDIIIPGRYLTLTDLKELSKHAMEGIKTLKNDKVGVENIYSKLRYIFEHYQEQGKQQKEQAYESLKAEFEAKIQSAVQQQLGSPAGLRIDVEKQPQFQEEWRKMQVQLDSQYLMLFDDCKRELKAIA